MGTLATHPLGGGSTLSGLQLLLIVLGAKMMLVDSQGEALLKMGSNKAAGHNEVTALTA